MRIKHCFNALPSRGEENNSPSLTVPSMTLGLRELIERYSSGGAVTMLKPVYTGNFPEIDKMDAIQKMELANELRTQIQKHQAGSRAEVKKPEPAPALSEDAKQNES